VCNAELCVSSPYYLRVHLSLLRLLSFKERPTEERRVGTGTAPLPGGGVPRGRRPEQALTEALYRFVL
jgi:hypothetical protein